jgi:hypothetical protein
MNTGPQARTRALLAVLVLTACTDGAVVAASDGGADAGDADASADAGSADGTSDAIDTADTGTCIPPDAASLDPAEILRGKNLVLQYNCAQCHGLALAGNPDGLVVAGSGRSYPPNLTPDPTTGVGCWSDDQIENAILFGRDDKGSALCAPMPIFSAQGLDVVGAHAIVHFLRSLPATVSQVPDTTWCDATDAGSDADAAPDGDASASDAHAHADARAGDASDDADAGADADPDADAGT